MDEVLATLDDEISIFAYGFGKKVIRQLVSFLQGDFQYSPAWLDDLDSKSRVDLAMLGFHLEIPALQSAALESLHRELIGNGRWANWGMLIHIWTVSNPKDPLRRLMLSALYLNLVVFAGKMVFPHAKYRLLPCDSDKGMWFSDLRGMVEAHSSIDAAHRDIKSDKCVPWCHHSIRSSDEISKHVGCIRDLSSRNLLQDQAMFSFPDVSASMKHRFAALDKECYIIADLTRPIDTPSALADEDDFSSAAASSPLKRKLDDEATTSPRPAKSARQQLKSTLPSKYDLIQVVHLELHHYTKRIGLAWLVRVSDVVENRVMRYPTLKKFKFHSIERRDFAAFREIAPALAEPELKSKIRPFSDIRSGLGIVAAAERLGCSLFEAEILELLKPIFKKTTMNFAIVKWVDQNTAGGSSGLRNFVGECLHWVLRKNGYSNYCRIVVLFQREVMPTWALEKMEVMCLEFGEKVEEVDEQELKEEKGEGKDVLKGEQGEGKKEVRGEEEKDDEKKEKKHPCAEMVWYVSNRDF